MLKRLIIKNFAIIENIDIDFDDKMTILTGQTGSGKSLIVDSISILMGKKAETVFVRNNCDEASLICYFDHYNEMVHKFLVENDLISDEHNQMNKIIKIERVITKNNKNSIKINDKNVNLNTLKSISNYLCDLHLQNDNLKLFDEENYLDIIDRYENEKTVELLNNYRFDLYNYSNSLSKYNLSLENQEKGLKNLDTLKFQFEEIDSLNANLAEKKTLEQDIEVLSNFDLVFETLNNSKNLLDSEDYNLDFIYKAVKEMNKISNIKEEYLTIYTHLEENYYSLKESLNNLSFELKNFDYDPNLLNSYNDRLNQINYMEKKYNKNIDQINSYKNEISDVIMMHENFELFIEEAKKELLKKLNKLKNSSLILSKERKKIALVIESKIVKEFNDLNLFNVLFKIEFQENRITDDFMNSDSFLENGIDKVNFLISLNLGEGFKPLNKIASGGEISRIMLALKSVLIKKYNFNLVVFDEIDTGISGEVAVKIAKKMKELSFFQQILCISHLPQVAGFANNQIEIEKYEEEGRTYSKFKKLNLEDRIYSIAKMLSGEMVTNFALSHAKELLIE